MVVVWCGSDELNDGKEDVETVSNSQHVYGVNAVPQWVQHVLWLLKSTNVDYFTEAVLRWETKSNHTGYQQCQVEDRVSAHQVQTAEWLF